MRRNKSLKHIWVPLLTILLLSFIILPWLLVFALPLLVPLAVYAMWRVRHHFPEGRHHPGHGHQHHT